MTKIFQSLLFSTLLLFSMPVNAHANCPAANKLARGIITTVTSPLEIPKQTRIYWKKGAEKTPHILVWILCGAVKGGVNMVARIGSGMWDIVSFPVAIPKDYKPLVDTKDL